jgi:hypothetical protein
MIRRVCVVFCIGLSGCTGLMGDPPVVTTPLPIAPIKTTAIGGKVAYDLLPLAGSPAKNKSMRMALGTIDFGEGKQFDLESIVLKLVAPPP